MIDNGEMRILEILSTKLLAKTEEISAAMGENDGAIPALQKLLSMDCVKVVEPIGEKCYVITQKGTRLLKEMKNPERRVQKQGFLTA
jgi:predicted transcriptional regulator